MAEHNHVLCEGDSYNELVRLFTQSRDLYIEEVVKNGMKQRDAAELFCLLHRHVNCQRACCRNSHEVNLWKIRKVFMLHESILFPIMSKDDFGEEDMRQLLNRALYPNRVKRVKTGKKQAGKQSMTFGCRLSEEDFESLAHIAYRYRLFDTEDEIKVKQILHSLLHCVEGFSEKVAHTGKIGLFLAALCDSNMIVKNWQRVTEERKSLMTNVGNPMTADKLANAISRIKKSDLKVYRTKGVHNDHYHIYIEVTDYFKEKKRCD